MNNASQIVNDDAVGWNPWRNLDNALADDNEAAASSLTSQLVVDFSVRPIVGGAVAGEDRARGEPVPQAEDGYTSWGGPGDTFGLALTPEQVNDPGFGFALALGDNTDDQTHYAVATGFGFAVPSGDTVTGLRFEAKAWTDGNVPRLGHVRAEVYHS